METTTVLKSIGFIVLVALAIGVVRYWVERVNLKSGAAKHCPYCRELINGKAIRCQHCHADLAR